MSEEPLTDEESVVERFDREAEEFDRATGYMRPGKDQPADSGGHSLEERRAAWDVWCRLRDRRAVDRVRIEELGGFKEQAELNLALLAAEMAENMELQNVAKAVQALCDVAPEGTFPKLRAALKKLEETE